MDRAHTSISFVMSRFGFDRKAGSTEEVVDF